MIGKEFMLHVTTVLTGQVRSDEKLGSSSDRQTGEWIQARTSATGYELSSEGCLDSKSTFTAATLGQCGEEIASDTEVILRCRTLHRIPFSSAATGTAPNRNTTRGSAARK